MITISSIPNNIRAPGIYAEMVYKGNPNGLAVLKQSVCIVAEKTAAGMAPANTPTKIASIEDGDTKAGKGSLAAIMVRMAKAQARYQGAEPEIWICPVDEPVGAKATKTLTYTVAAPKSGNHTITVGRFTITVGVSTTDTATSLAAKVKAELDKLGDSLPITIGVAAGVVTCTFTTNGVNGNDLTYRHVESPSGVSVVIATGTPGSGAALIAPALAALYDRVYNAVAFSNHTATDASAWLIDAASAWSAGNELFRWAFFGETGSIGTAQTMQAALNDYRSIIVSCEQHQALPGELAVACAVAAFGTDKPNAGFNNKVLALPAPPQAYAYTTGDGGEVETLLDSGITPLRPTDNGLTKIVRLVTTTRTVSGVVFEGTRDLAYSRTTAYMSTQVTFGFVQGGFDNRDFNEDYLRDFRAMVVGKHKSAEAAGYIRNVDVNIESIRVEESTTALGRALLEDPFEVAGPAGQVFAKHIMYFPIA